MNQNPDPAKRHLFGAGDSNTDVTFLRDASTLTDNKEALIVLKKMTDWAVKTLPRRKDEWYTLPENLYSCYALTNDARYLQMAKEYDYSKEYYDPFANGVNAFTPDRHAYSHVNTLCSAAKAYEVTGNEKYFKAIAFAATWLFRSSSILLCAFPLALARASKPPSASKSA